MKNRWNLQRPRLNLHIKVALPSILLLVGTLTVLFIAYRYILKSAEEQASANLHRAVMSVQRRFDGKTGELRIQTEVMADELGETWPVSAKNRDFQRAQGNLAQLSSYFGLDGFAVSDRKGNRIIQEGELFGEEVGKMEEEASSGVELDMVATRRGLQLVASAPVANEKGEIGFLTVGKLVDSSFLAELRDETGSELSFYFGGNKVSTRRLPSFLDSAVYRAILREKLPLVLKQGRGSGEESILYAPLMLGESRRGLMAVSLSARAYLPTNSSRYLVGAAAGTFSLFLLLILLNSALLARRVTQPLSKLSQAAILISEGELECSLPAVKTGEVGKLARSFASMLEALRDEQQRVQKRIQRLSKKLYRLSRLNSLAQRMIGSRLRMGYLVEEILDVTRNLVHADAVCLFFVDTKERLLHLVSQQGWSAPPQRNVMLGEGVTGWAALKGEPLLLSDLEGKETTPLEWEKGMKSAMMVPLRKSGQVRGLLVAAHAKFSSAFQKDDLELLSAVAALAAAAIEGARAVEERQERLLETVKALAAAVDAKSPYAREHSQCVARYAAAIGKRLSFSPEETEELELAAYLHDIGKIEIPDRILGKAEGLSDAETQLLKEHPRLGREILSGAGFSWEILSAVAHHHEWYAGGGYPSSLMGDEISQGARVLAVADSFERLISGGPERLALSSHEAVEELKKNSGICFDPLVVEAFLDAFQQDPSLVASPSHEYIPLLQ